MYSLDNLLFLSKTGITYKTKKEILAHKIIERIVTGLLRDQDELPGERDLSKLFGVSRESVRGGLSIVANYGLITVSHGSKTRVSAPEEKLAIFRHQYSKDMGLAVNTMDIDTVFEARIVIEQALIQKTVERITKTQIDHLKSLVIEQESTYHHPVAFQLSDQEFHKLLAEYSGNELLKKYSKQLYHYALIIRRKVMSNPSMIENSVKEHHQIVSMLEKNDSAGTLKALTKHLSTVYQTTKDALL